MNRIVSIAVMVLALFALFAPPEAAIADTGWENATRIERGSYSVPRSVSLSTATGTALWSADTKRPDSLCRNNSAYTIWIGTDTSSYIVGNAGPNVLNGFPVKSSETFKLDGSYTGTMAATADPAAGATGANVRCLDALVR